MSERFEPTSSAYPDPLAGPGAGTPGDRLAALLQTAVDDQVAEQRQLSQLLTEVREALADRGGDGATLQDVHDGLAGLRTDLRVVPETVSPAVAQAVGAGLTDVGRTLERLEAAQEATSRDLTALKGELVELRPRLEGYGPRLDALPQVAAALTALTERSTALEGVPAALNALRAQVDGVRASQVAMAASPHTGLAGSEIANIVREGVRDATRDFVRDYLRDAVQDIVTVSTRDTERRITDHVDEAVLALAQALLRRRPALEGVQVPHSEHAPSTPASGSGSASASASASEPGPSAAPTVDDRDPLGLGDRLEGADADDSGNDRIDDRSAVSVADDVAREADDIAAVQSDASTPKDQPEEAAETSTTTGSHDPGASDPVASDPGLSDPGLSVPDSSVAATAPDAATASPAPPSPAPAVRASPSPRRRRRGFFRR